MRQATQAPQDTAQLTSPRRQARDAGAPFADLRASTLALHKLAQLMADSPIVTQQKRHGAMMSGPPAQAQAAPAPGANRTGLPDRLKSGIENLSGMALDDVRVHYNSSRPAQLQALAYAQGNEIHVAPGQESHLPHEAWHVVQQKQGRVHATAQAKGVPLNDEQHLEHEADIMGQRALTAHGAPVQAVLQPTSGAHRVQRKRAQPDGATYVDMTSEDVWLSDILTRKGHLFSKTLPQAADRATLLQQLSKEGETVGHSHTAVEWNKKTSDYDKSTVAATDPFRIRLGGTYNAAPDPATLELDYHFGGFNMGYVVKVRDHGAAAAMENRGHRSGQIGTQAGVSPSYSNRHHALADARLMTSSSTLGATVLSSEQAFDSTTKLAGEGARFRCVLQHQGALADSSKFFIRLEDAKVVWVTFDTLWLTWSATFNKTFGITDKQVSAKLESNALRKIGVGGVGVEAVPRGAGSATNLTTGRDYNLTTGAPAVAEDCKDLITLRVIDKHSKNPNKTHKLAIQSKLDTALNTIAEVKSYATVGSNGRSWNVKVWSEGGKDALQAAFDNPDLGLGELVIE
ncbi:DUF4157 domain-containing protein [Janthinobacterium sp. Mn2066]|uniref:eCIS core domain-containing protein n=1 Tax=Janthinobacterium sp. Mn2066 TaxID=3395264 RepID=UPI003BBA10BE